MKAKILFFSLFILGVFLFNPVFAEDEEREVPVFSEVTLKIEAKVHIEQGDEQSVEVVAKQSTLDDLITEVKGKTLIIRYPNKNMFKNSFQPGKVEIFITVPDIGQLTVSGSGDILAEEIESRIISLNVSGSGNIVIDELKSKKVSANISGSGDILINDGGVADELTLSISGSGNLKALDFEATDVAARISGSGNCSITSNGALKARIAGSGNVNYKGNPSIDSSVVGSGRVKEM